MVHAADETGGPAAPGAGVAVDDAPRAAGACSTRRLGVAVHDRDRRVPAVLAHRHAGHLVRRVRHDAGHEEPARGDGHRGAAALGGQSPSVLHGAVGLVADRGPRRRRGPVARRADRHLDGADGVPPRARARADPASCAHRGADHRGQPAVRLVLAGGTAVRTPRLDRRDRDALLGARAQPGSPDRLRLVGPGRSRRHVHALLRDRPGPAAAGVAPRATARSDQGRDHRLHPPCRRGDPVAGGRVGAAGEEPGVDRRLPADAAVHRDGSSLPPRTRGALRSVVGARRGGRRHRGGHHRSLRPTERAVRRRLDGRARRSPASRSHWRRRWWAPTTSSVAT